MKISTKSRYALASLIILAEHNNEEKNVTTTFIAQKLDISKLYLEQIFSQLKRAKFVLSEKGFQGGYRLAKSMQEIYVGDVMRLFEVGIFEKTEQTFSDNSNYIDTTMDTMLWSQLDERVHKLLDSLSLYDLVKKAEMNKINKSYMYYI